MYFEDSCLKWLLWIRWLESDVILLSLKRVLVIIVEVCLSANGLAHDTEIYQSMFGIFHFHTLVESFENI